MVGSVVKLQVHCTFFPSCIYPDSKVEEHLQHSASLALVCSERQAIHSVSFLDPLITNWHELLKRAAAFASRVRSSVARWLDQLPPTEILFTVILTLSIRVVCNKA